MIGIVPGAEWATKRWGEERYAELSGRLAAGGATLLLLGGPDEREMARAIAARCGTRAIDTTGNSIPEAIALLARCDLVVGGRHRARALRPGAGPPHRPPLRAHRPGAPRAGGAGAGGPGRPRVLPVPRSRTGPVPARAPQVHDRAPGHRGGAPGARPARGGNRTRRRIEVDRMIRSMTGFGAGKGGAAGEVVEAEVRSVNHKFCEVKARLPREMSPLETELVRQVKDRLARGGIEFTLRRSTARGTLAPRVDAELAAAYARAFEEVRARLGLSGPVSLSEVLGADGVVTLEERAVDLDSARTAGAEALAAALDALVAMREREGAALARDLESRLAVVEAIAARLAELSPRLGGGLPGPPARAGGRSSRAGWRPIRCAWPPRWRSSPTGPT